MTTKAQALDHLTDVLAGEDVAGEPTVAGAIDKLATMIENGDIVIGGGGDSGGEDTSDIILVEWNYTGSNPPSVAPADIYAAVEAGKIVVFKYQDSRGVPEEYRNFDYPVYLYLTNSAIMNNEYEPPYKYHMFSGFTTDVANNKNYMEIFRVLVDNRRVQASNPFRITSA